MVNRCLKTTLSSLAVILLLITALNSNAQITNDAMGTSPWKFANPSPIGFTFTDMSFINNNIGLGVSPAALSGGGGIMRTTDGGRNWQAVTHKYVTSTGSVTLASFNDVQFVTPAIAYAVGSGGLMIKSTDGGINWARVTTPLTALGRNINALHFLNKDTGYIGGAAINTTNTTSINDAPKVYFTRNGGNTWDSLATPFRPQQNAVTLSGFNSSEIQRIHFVNDSVGYATGSCGQSVANYSAILWKIQKNVVLDYSIHRTKFGITATTGSHTPSTQTYKGLLGINDSLVLISSLNNNVVLRVRTGKNDSTRSVAPAIFGAYERGVYEIMIWLNSTATPFPANLVGNVAGQMPQIKRGPDGKIYLSCGASILVSNSLGSSWTFTKPHPTTVNYGHWGFAAMDITPEGRIVVGTNNGLTYDSLPGSSGWSTVYKNVRPLFYGLSAVDWADLCNGVAVGSNGTILKTSDGGKTWVNNSSPIFDAAQISLNSVQYHAVNNMYFATFSSIYRTPDQGTTNDVIFAETNPNGQINKFTMVGTTRAYAIGHRFSGNQRTLIFRSLNANTATPVWDTVKTFPLAGLAPQLRNIEFANQDTGYVCGSRGKVYRTINGGNTWTDISPDTLVNSNGTTTYTALSVVNGKTIFLGGSSRKLFRSFDAGVTWQDLTLVVPPAPTPLSNFTSIGTIVMNDPSNGYIAAGGILLKTIDAWSSYTYDLSPGSFSNISLYPKMNLPISQKKLYGTPLTAGSSVNSQNTAFLIEYGNTALTTVATSETVTGSSCTNPNAGTISITTTGGLTPYTYSINGGTPQASGVFTGLTQGPKTVVIKDAGCQTVTKTITIPFTDNLTLAGNNDTLVCAGAPVQLQATGNAAAFAWSPAAGLSGTTISNPVATVSSNTAFTVTASLNGCVKTKTINVNMKPSPAINAGPDKSIVVGDEVLLNGSAANPVTITWTPNTTLTNANTLAPIAKPNVTTTYTLTVRDINSCTSTDNAVVNVIPYCVKVMNAFTPNGDGMNDRWLVTIGAVCTKQIEAVVFNRYGHIVYKHGNYQNDWDGTYSGKPVPDGTYYYTITYTTITDKKVFIKGDVTILR